MTTTAHPTQRRVPMDPLRRTALIAGPCYLTDKGFKPSPITADRPEEN